jgi:hypothetical protein
MTFKNGENGKMKKTREGPAEFMRAFLNFIKKNPEHKNLTTKGFAIIREERKKK